MVVRLCPVPRKDPLDHRVELLAQDAVTLPVVGGRAEVAAKNLVCAVVHHKLVHHLLFRTGNGGNIRRNLTTR